MLEIHQARSEIDFDHVRALIGEYIHWDCVCTSKLGFDVDSLLVFQYSDALEKIPGAYEYPKGYLLLAKCEGVPAGCGAFHSLSPSICEIKRLYVKPGFRGKRIGKKLLINLIEKARQLKYKIIRVETTTFMEEALKLYHQLGFKVIEPYYSIPQEFRDITIFMELKLNE